MMKFNLSDFVQLDTKGLLAINGGGYYCNGSSNTTVYSNPYYTGSSEGGTCISKNDTDKVSGMFGQITDGSYADTLTMQKYKNEPYKYQPNLDEKMNGDGNTFSHQDCKMTAAAKIASEVTGKDVDIFLDINQKWDSGKDGYLTKEEIAAGLNDILDNTYGDAFDVTTESRTNLSINDLKDFAKRNQDEGTTFVLAKVNLGDLNADGENDYHWVVIEGYSQDSKGKITFSYDGTSDNDVGRTVILGGQPNPGSKIGTVFELQSFTVTRK